jgi:uncharacterized protein (TIGR01319 family)
VYNVENVRTIIATDCGSTTTKAILILKKGESYRLAVRGEAPTTVEAPFEDVTRGVLNSMKEVEELSNVRILDGEILIRRTSGAPTTLNVDHAIETLTQVLNSTEGKIKGKIQGTLDKLKGLKEGLVPESALAAIREVEKQSGRKILEGRKLIPGSEDEGVDLYVSTSSAGGGLQMLVAGVVKSMTAESAARAALGAGAIVMDVIASNDKRLPHERVELIRRLRPDMILLAGGVDGGTTKHVLELAELIKAAEPRPRFGVGYELPVIYAGNVDAQTEIQDLLEEKSALSVVDNIRPVLERENLQPARDEIHDLFMEHVMAHAPGYKKLMSWTDVAVMPTPGAVGLLVESVARKENIQVIGVDIGGATTDIFSVFGGKFNRTVSANLGMSYSISNVLVEAGVENILRWVPFRMGVSGLRNRIRNKMIRPTTIPQTLEELIIEQSIAREALRLAFEHHKTMAVGLKGIQQERTISEAFSQSLTGETLVDMMGVGLIIGSGGALSHAPRRVQAAMMMLDAFQPEGVTMLAVDSIFMMPHLGVLSTVHEKAATEVFDRDCLIRLGTSVAPRGQSKPGKSCLKLFLTDSGGKQTEHEVDFGDILRIPVEAGETVQAVIEPDRSFDVGEGKGKKLEIELEGGLAGIIVDCRGRPLPFSEDAEKRITDLSRWIKQLEVYPVETYDNLIEKRNVAPSQH